MGTQTKHSFLTFYNNTVPGWKRMLSTDLIKDKNLDKIVNSIVDFIHYNNLDAEKLVLAIVDHFYKKTKRYPTIFSFKGAIALNLYNKYQLEPGQTLTKLQKIAISVRKSKILVKSMEENGIVYSKGVRSLQTVGKADPYFLLAHGIREGIADYTIKEWESSDEIKDMVLNEILS